MSSKIRLKPLNPTSSSSSSNRATANDNVHIPVFRSRSIDSVPASDEAAPTAGVDATGGGGCGGDSAAHEDKAPSSATFAKTFRTLRKRLSRTSNSRKKEQATNVLNPNDYGGKSGGDDSEASSTGEETGTLAFSALPTSNSDLTDLETSTAVPFRVHRSLPAEKAPEIVTSSPPDLSDSLSSSNDNPMLSKTWSPSTFTGAQLRGTCSLEYTEHMKDKSHKRKAHMIDLRKDDGQYHQQLTPNAIFSSSKHSIASTTTASYHNHCLTHVNLKGALTKSF